MKRIIIVHGWDGFPEEGWFPWLKRELENKGFQVQVPAMPEPAEPKIEAWVSHLSKIVGDVDENTFFVGHSIGCQAILRYLESLSNDKKVSSVVFVAGWFNLENLEDEETVQIAKPWIETPINLEKVKTILSKSTLIISDNDPYDAFEENKVKFTELGSEIVVIPKAGHIDGKAGYKKLPEALEALESILA